jgi:hypothetical protein
MQVQQMLLLAHKYEHIYVRIFASGIQALTTWSILPPTLLLSEKNIAA